MATSNHRSRQGLGNLSNPSSTSHSECIYFFLEIGTMKTTRLVALVLAIPLTASAFLHATQQETTARKVTRNSAVATSFEEDLELTLKVIMDHVERSVTTCKDQFMEQMKEVQEIEEAKLEGEVVSVSIPYDAAAKNAYDESDKSMPYEEFKTTYETDAKNQVIAKQIPKQVVQADATVAKRAKTTSEAEDDVVVADDVVGMKTVRQNEEKTVATADDILSIEGVKKQTGIWLRLKQKISSKLFRKGNF